MKISTIMIAFLILLSQSVFSQESTFEDNDNTFGLKASNISGYGLYYNRKLSDDLRLQLMGLAFYLYSLDNGIEHKNFNYDIGLEIQQDIAKGYNTRLYILAGAFYYLDDDQRDGNSTLFKSVNHSFNAGIGIGGLYYYKKFVISLELGYKFFEDNLEITNENGKSYPELHRVTKVGAGVGIGFMF